MAVIISGPAVVTRSQPSTDVGANAQNSKSDINTYGLNLDRWSTLNTAQQGALASLYKSDPAKETQTVKALNALPLPNFADKAASTLGSIVKAPMALADFLGNLAYVGTWIRVGEGIAGVVAIAFGIVLLARDLGISVPTPARKITEVAKEVAP